MADLDRVASQALATRACSAVAMAMGSVDKTGRLVLRHMANYGHATMPPPTIRLGTPCQFDLGRLTGGLVPALLALQWTAKNRLDLDRTLGELLPEGKKSPFCDVPLSMLLDHTSGVGGQLEALQAIVDSVPKPERAPIRSGLEAREPPRKTPTETILRRLEAQGGPLSSADEAKLRKAIVMLQPEALPGQIEANAQLDFLLLGWALEAAGKASLDTMFRRDVLAPLHVLPAHVGFRRAGAKGPYQPPSSRAGEANAVATAACPFRRRTPHGECNDILAYLFGGIAGHDGLFGTIEGLWALCAPLLDAARGRPTPLHAASVGRFFSRSRQIDDARFALGWEIACRANGMAPGRWHPKSVGLVCPSGQSIFLDPGYGVLGILLTNWGVGRGMAGTMSFDTFRVRVFDTMASLAGS